MSNEKYPYVKDMIEYMENIIHTLDIGLRIPCQSFLVYPKC